MGDTLILQGHDWNGAFKNSPHAADPLVIDYSRQSIPEAVKNQTPRALILAAHGSEDGNFLWKEGEYVPYANLFSLLPRTGLDSIVLESCYGGSAEAIEFLKAAPPGTVIISLIGKNNPGDGSFVNEFEIETSGTTDPTSLVLKSLETFSPATYKRYTEYWNAQNHTNDDSNPEHALPHIVGIGGNYPIAIDLDEEYRHLSLPGLNQNAWKAAIERTQDIFVSLFSHEEEKSRFDTIAQKLRSGIPIALTDDPVQNAEEKRIAYALAAAYLEESGELQMLRVGAMRNSGITDEDIHAFVARNDMKNPRLSTFSAIPGALQLQGATESAQLRTLGLPATATGGEDEKLAAIRIELANFLGKAVSPSVLAMPISPDDIEAFMQVRQKLGLPANADSFEVFNALDKQNPQTIDELARIINVQTSSAENLSFEDAAEIAAIAARVKVDKTTRRP